MVQAAVVAARLLPVPVWVLQADISKTREWRDSKDAPLRTAWIAASLPALFNHMT